jgi:hypothetical protein
MKKSLVVLLVLGLLMGALVGAADAKKKKKKPVVPVKVTREATLDYQCPCGPSAGGQAVGFWAVDGTLGGGPVPSGADENYVSVHVQDAGGGPVFVRLGQDVDGDLQSETQIGDVCGKSDTPLAIPNPGVDVSIFVYDGFCPDGSTPSQATSGTVHLTFSNIP